MPNKLFSNFCASEKNSRGRLFAEKEDKNRSIYQRDRDRIIHSSAFRRLEHKTQVFVHHEGDHYRSRLTHSLEVSQIARTIAKHLGLNEELSETISLAHDLGHTPFGHAGENALNKAMKKYGGFNHNAHTLRIITFLEKKYLNFDGLNLTWETLEGIVKHNGPFKSFNIPFAIKDYNKIGMDLELDTWCGPEAQIASLSDDIAYFSHDIEDGIRASFFDVEDMIENLSLMSDFLKGKKSKIKNLDSKRVVNELRRFVISKMIEDLIKQTKHNLNRFEPKTIKDIRLLKTPIANFSTNMKKNLSEIRKYLTQNMYMHWKVNRMTSKARRIVSDLFDVYNREPNCLPADWLNLLKNPKDKFAKARLISDYIAGMTDRYAINEHKKLYDLNTGWQK